MDLSRLLNPATTEPSRPKVPFETNGDRIPGREYIEREAVCAVVLYSTGKHINIVPLSDSYKLPGGEIEKGEDHKVTLQRKIYEEVDERPSIDNISLIAMSEEFDDEIHQTSFCYLAKLTEEQTGVPEMTDDEFEKDEAQRRADEDKDYNDENLDDDPHFDFDPLQGGWLSIKMVLEVLERTEEGTPNVFRDIFFVETFQALQSR